MFLLAIGCVSSATAKYDPSWPGQKDFPLLPAYCRARLDKSLPPQEGERWKARLGEDFGMVVHHYCAGLNFLRRAGLRQEEPSDKPNLLIQAANEFGYVVEKASPSFVLLPEVHVNRGRANNGLNRVGDALRDFQRAIDLRPDWPGGYLALAEMYAARGMMEDAKSALNAGIEKASDPTVLKSRLATLETKR